MKKRYSRHGSTDQLVKLRIALSGKQARSYCHNSLVTLNSMGPLAIK